MKAKKRNKRKEESLDSATNPADLKEMAHDELSGPDPKRSSLASSATDDDENEGVGDGNIGRSKDDLLGHD
jgi:hypothetical protein